MTDVYPEVPTVRALLEQAWECIAPLDAWTQGEEYLPKDKGDGGQACIIGAVSVALLGGYGVVSNDGYTDFYAVINNQMKSRSFAGMMETLPIQAMQALVEALKQEFPDLYTFHSKLTRKSHETHLRGYVHNATLKDHKEGSLYANALPCFFCNGEEDDLIGLMVSFNDREVDPNSEIWNRYPLIQNMHPYSQDPEFLRQKEGYRQDIRKAAAKIHSEVVAVFQRAIKNEIQKEEAA